MARFFPGDFSSVGGPPRSGTFGESQGGGLGTAAGPVAVSAAARAIMRALRRRLEERELDQISDRIRRNAIQQQLSEELRRLMDDLSHPPRDSHRPVHGQEGYTKIWADKTYVCGLPPQSRWFWTGLSTDPAGGPMCRNFGAESDTMEGASDLLYKFFWRHEQNAFHKGSSEEGYIKTGTPGPGHELRPLARPETLRPVAPKPVTALDPWTVEPGSWRDNRQISFRIIVEADILADRTEPDAEGRSRSSGDPRVETITQVQLEISLDSGTPLMSDPGSSFPEPFKGNEKKVIMGIRAGSMLGRALNAVTESLDVTNVVYNALEERCKPKGRTNQIQRFQTVISNIGCVNIAKMLEGLVRNEIEDLIIGITAGGAARQSARATGSGRGSIPSQFGKPPGTDLIAERDAITVFGRDVIKAFEIAR